MDTSFEAEQSVGLTAAMDEISRNESDDMVQLKVTTSESEVSSTKKRRLTSIVWQFFEPMPLGEDKKRRAKCKKCSTSYIFGGSHGTKNMKLHMERCHRYGDASQGTPFAHNDNFDHDKFRELVATTVIMHDLPFQFVEWVGIRDLLLYLRKDMHVVSGNTCVSDCLKVYNREKDKIQIMLDETPGRISLTFECWSSLTTDGYICLTAHFIDKNWHLQKRILSFCFMPPPHNGLSFCSKIMTLLSNWKIDKRVMSITFDNASANDTCVDLLKTNLTQGNGFLFGGEYLQMRCCAHILNLMVQDGLTEIDPIVQKIRESVKYVKGSQGRKQRFLECVAHNSLDAKRGLRQDVPTRWNTTFIMLENALYYRIAFMQMKLSDSNYLHCPSKGEWDDVEKICKFLGTFYEITCLFSGTNYPTANLYYPAMFSICLTLKREMESDDEYMRNMASTMYGKLDKYWADFSERMAIAVVLDPRYKFSFVQWCHKKLYGDRGALKSLNLKEKLTTFYNNYRASSSSSKVSYYPSSQDNNMTNVGGILFSSKTRELLEEFDSFLMQEASPQKTQLEQYLEEVRLDRKQDLDILAYWRADEYRFPEVAAMARDVLSIPISTVAFESAFSVGGRVLDQYKSALKPEIVEALICTRDWLYGTQEVGKSTLEELTEDIISLDINDTESSSSVR